MIFMVLVLKIFDANSSEWLEKITVLGEMFKKNSDLVLIYPTETCYALGCRISSKKGIERIYGIKERERGKQLPVIACSLEMAEKYCELEKNARKLANEFMPGPLTLVVKKKCGSGSIAFRVSGNEIARKLCKAAGEPLISTSANISGEREIYSGEEAIEKLGEKVDVIIDAGELAREKPSTVYNVENGRVLREGPVDKEEILKALEK